jgi:8-oxo-dGTP diphosphatase
MLTETLREHAAVRWVGADELDRLDWAEADVPVVGRVRELMRGSAGER